MPRKPEDISQYKEAVLGTVKGIIADPKQGVLSGPLLRRILAAEYDGLSKDQIRALTTYVTGMLITADTPQTAVKVGLSYPNSVHREKVGDTDIFYNDGAVHKNKVPARHEEMMLEAQAVLDLKKEEKEQRRVQAEEQKALQRKEIQPSTASIYVYATLDDELDTRSGMHTREVVGLHSPTEGMLAFEALAPIDVLQRIASNGLTAEQLKTLQQTLPDELIAYATQVEQEAASYAGAIVADAEQHLKRPGKSLGMKVQVLDSHASAVVTLLDRNHLESITQVEEVSRFPYKPYIREVVDRWIGRYTSESIEGYTEALQVSTNIVAQQLLEMDAEQLDIFARDGYIALETGELTKEAADTVLKPIIFSEDMMTKVLFYNFLDALYPVRYALTQDPVRFEYAGRALRFVTDLFIPEEMQSLMLAPSFDEAAYKGQLKGITQALGAVERRQKQAKPRRGSPAAQQFQAELDALNTQRKALVNQRAEAIKTPYDRVKQALLDRTPQHKPNPGDYKDGENSVVYQHLTDVYEAIKYINYYYWDKQVLRLGPSSKNSLGVSEAFTSLLGKDTSSQRSMNRRQ